MSKLLPCPFCGGEAEAVHEINGFWTVECVKCGALVDGIEAWNTRHHFGLTDEDYNILLDEMGLSERTCRMTDRGECSECGAYIVRAWTEVHDFNGDMKRIDLRSHNYCPNCGAKVVSE